MPTPQPIEVPLALIGGLYTEALPETLPLGASPLVINCDFILGSNLQRPGKQSIYTFGGISDEVVAGFAASIPGQFAPNETAWSNPSNATRDIPGTYASATLNVHGFSAGGTFDNATTNSGSTATATASGAPTAEPELAMLFCAAGAASGGGRPGSPGSPWSLLTNPNDINTTLYVQALSSVAPLNPSQAISNSENWCTALAFFGAKTQGVAPTIVQQRNIISGSVSAGQHTVSFNNPTTAGNGILVVLSGSETSNPIVTFTITDNQGNVYTEIFAVTIGFNPGNPFGTSSPTMWAVWAPNIPGGTVTMTSTVTVTTFNGGAGGVSGSIVAFEIGGIAPVPASLPHSQILQTLNFPFSILNTEEILGLQLVVGGNQSAIPADAILTATIVDANGDVSTPMTFQLPLSSDGLVTVGNPTSNWNLNLSPALLNNPNLQVQIVAQATNGEIISFNIYAAELLAWLSPNPPPSFNYIKTFAETDGAVLTLALGSNGIMYQEDVVNNPNVLTSAYTQIQPNSFAQSATVDDREFIAISNLLNGTDIPYTYNPPNFDRLSQVGPGAPPSCTTSQAGSPIVSITQNAAHPLNTGPHDFLLVSAAPSDTGSFGAPSTPGNVMTIIFASSETVPPEITVGSDIVISGFPTINGNVVNNDPTGVTAPPFYTITSVGQAIVGQQSYDAFSFTVGFTTFYNKPTPGGCKYQSTTATMTTSVQVPNLEVGNQFQASGTGGAPPAGYDSTWTVLTTPNAAQMVITSTQLLNNVATYGFSLETGSNPAVGEAVTVTLTLNGNGIFNVTNAIITATTPGTFSISLPGANIANAAENGAGIIFGTIFTFDAFAIIGNKTGGQVTTAGVIGIGQRECCYSFLTRNGFLSQPSPIFKFDVVAGAANIAVAQLLTGPSNVIARVVHFTAANGGNFYNIPDPVTVDVNGVSTVNTSTWVNDNVSTNAIFSFSDEVLLRADQIDIEGNNLFECVELGSCVALVPYSERIAAIGEQNKIINLLNYSFDGGRKVITSAGGSTSTYPAGWTVDPVNGAGGSVISSPIFGFAYAINNQSGSTQAIYGMITQEAFQDEFNVPIIAPNTLYSVRATFSVPTGIPSGGNLVIDLFSPSLGRSVGTFSVPLASAGSSMGIFTGTLLTTALSPVPNDLLIRIYATQIPNGTEVVIDRFEPFPTLAPNNNTQIIFSYADAFEQFDRETGVVKLTQQNQQVAVTAFPLFGILNVVKTGSMLALSDNNTTEPNNWNKPRVTSNAVGAFGPYAITFGIDEPNSGEEWSLVAGPSGLFIYQGSQPIKLSEEIQSLWNQINSQVAYKSWVKNDVAGRRVLVGVPLNALNAQGQVPPYLPTGLIPTTPPTDVNVILEMNYKQLNTASAVADNVEIHRSYSGKMIASDVTRKWSIWTIQAPCAAFIQRQNGSTPLFLGNSQQTGKIYQLIDGLMQDDGSPIDQIYATAGFVPTETGEGMQLGTLRYVFDYMAVLINGAGSLTITVCPNTLNGPYSHTLLPNLTLPASTNGDVEIPVNEEGSRLFLIFNTNALAASFALARVVMYMSTSGWSPFRGENS